MLRITRIKDDIYLKHILKTDIVSITDNMDTINQIQALGQKMMPKSDNGRIRSGIRFESSNAVDCG